MRNTRILAGAAVSALLVGVPMPALADGLREALSHLRQARAALDRAWDDKGGHKKKALDRIDEASDAINDEMRHSGGDRWHDDDRHGDRHDDRRRDDDRRHDGDHRRDQDRDRDGARGGSRGGIDQAKDLPDDGATTQGGGKKKKGKNQ